MSRDWTPMEWDIMHQSYPKLRDHWLNVVWRLEDGTEIPFVSDERKAILNQYPKFSLVGINLLNRCIDEGITEKGKEILNRMESILNGDMEVSDFADAVHLWYEGELESGYYMDANDSAMLEVIKGELK